MKVVLHQPAPENTAGIIAMITLIRTLTGCSLNDVVNYCWNKPIEWEGLTGTVESIHELVNMINERGGHAEILESDVLPTHVQRDLYRARPKCAAHRAAGS